MPANSMNLDDSVLHVEFSIVVEVCESLAALLITKNVYLLFIYLDK